MSYPSQSASQVNGIQTEQFEKMVEMVSSLSSRVGDLTGRLSSLQLSHEGERTCPYCKLSGHRVSECPKKASDKAAKAAAKEKEGV